MAQKKDLNISPYYDDFDSNKNFYKVLFKPGFPVQARELTNLQSILQNQIEEFGTHMFKEGSIVIPGAPTYDGQFDSVILDANQFGIDISVYIDSFKGKVVEGQTSGVTGTIDFISLPDGGEIEKLTVFVKYLNSGTNSNNSTFIDGESLMCNENVVYGNTTINAGNAFATLISSGATSIGSAASVAEGVYFIRGTFVNVDKQTIILDPYTNNPSYRIGLQINESIVTAKEDNSLYDNAKGFTNYAAPGADRFKIGLVLTKKLISDVNDTDFVEILRVRDGEIRKITSKTNYNIIKDWIAERTFEESGNYSLQQFDINVQNSLNDRLGNNGIFFEGQQTEQGNTPSDDLMCVKISGGEAYVRGYDVTTDSVTILDVDKPRDTQNVKSANIPFSMGNILVINNLQGQPQYRNVVELHKQLDTASLSSTTLIGKARLYSCTQKDAIYENNASKWNLRLYDIQTYTELTLNRAVSNTQVDTSYLIKGKISGATGYATAQGGNSTTVFVRETSGSFIRGEAIIIQGNASLPRTITNVKQYSTKDILSVQQLASQSSNHTQTFRANAFLETVSIPNIDEVLISGVDATAYGQPFTGIKVGDIVRYNTSNTDPVFNTVTAISADSLRLTLGAISGGNVSGIYHSAVVTGSYKLRLGVPSLNDNNLGLFEILPDPNIESLDFSSSTLPVSAQITGQAVSSGGVDLSVIDVTDGSNSGIVTAFFEGYSVPRYSVHYGSTSGVGTVRSSDFSLDNSGGSTASIKGLKTSDSNTVVSITAKKQGIQSKVKNYIRSQIQEITLSNLPESGSTVGTSLNDKLTYNNTCYGLRVQDQDISLNVPDVVKVLAVYESINGLRPSLDTISFSATAAVGNNAIIGENIIGKTSNAIARVVTNSGTTPSTDSTNKLGIVYLNDKKFVNYEQVTFQESNIVTRIDGINTSDNEAKYQNITKSYNLDKGQKDQYYDYSRLVRRENSNIPSKRLLIIYDKYDVPASDTGDVFTALSYSKDRYSKDIPLIGISNVRATDTLDFRPRVSNFVGATASPFDFDSRVFSTEPKFLVSANESTLLGYDFYLGRIDKLYLSEYGILEVIKGEPARNPAPPQIVNNSMELGTLTLPPYLYNPNHIGITLTDNRRYTMRDIGILEDRIQNLETVTTLSLLEVGTEALTIQDAQGNTRFKSGFFVDDFKDVNLIDSEFSKIELDSENNQIKPTIARNSIQSQLMPASSTIDSDLDFGTNFTLLDSNVQKTGDVVTLKYEETDYLDQPLATRVENINPFHVIAYAGTIRLTPRQDSWVRTIRVEPTTTTVTRRVIDTQDWSQTGRWRTTGPWVGWSQDRRDNLWAAQERGELGPNSTGTTETTQESIVTRDVVLSSGDEQWMRSRNTKFVTDGVRPFTRHYQFLDGNSDVSFIPKLLEITPDISDSGFGLYGSVGTFKVGETVKGYDDEGKLLISFRVAQANHKSGAFNNPDKVYTFNPYLRTETLSSEYTTSSKILNVDTRSLASENQGLYSGYLELGTRLVGQESGALAYVKDLKLVSDVYGNISGSFFLKDPFADPAPTVRISTGAKTYALNSSSSNEKILPGSKLGSSAQVTYRSTGNFVVRQMQTQINMLETTTIVTMPVEREDPLAQSFTVAGNIQAPGMRGVQDDEHGVFLTSVDIYFARKDTGNQPVSVQIRTMELGTPTLNVLGSTVTLLPEDITISENANIATNVKFPEPIFLPPGREYAVVLLAPTSDQYEVWIARMGEKTVNTQALPDASSVVYTQQWAVGSLFKSQNGSIWSPSQLEDMKFKLYKAKFTSTSGSVFFTTPTLDRSNNYETNLGSNPIITLPKSGKIGITTIGTSGDSSASSGIGTLVTGRTIVGDGNDGTSAVIVGTGSSAYTLTKTSSGSGYKTGQTEVQTFAITGQGEGLLLDFSITGTNHEINTVSLATGTDGGRGYQIGDVVGIVTSSAGGQGIGAEITISSINTSVNTLFLSNIQGTPTSFKNTEGIRYRKTNGTIESFVTAPTPVFSSDLQGGEIPNDGRHFIVRQFDHGMHSANNKVKITDVQSNIESSLLSGDVTQEEVTSISVASTAQFDTFEGIPVGVGSTGYLKIEDEVIGYLSMTPNGSGGGTLDTLTRGVDGTRVIPHINGSNVLTVNKYELNGVSLRRINTEHQLSNFNIGLDSYYIAIDDTKQGKDRSVDVNNISSLSFNQVGFGGGELAHASRNIQFDALIPNYNITTPSTVTKSTASIRTVSGTSIGGNEVSFEDQGYQSVQINTLNELSTPRLICSKVNEDTYLTQLERSKGFVTALRFTTTNENVSPVVNTEASFTEFRSNRLNKPVDNYSNSSETKSWWDDPHSAIYVSNTVTLDKPADGLKVIVSAYRDESADFRVLYSLIRPDSSGISQNYEFFPGYDNMKDTSGDGFGNFVIDPAKNNGLPDAEVSASKENEFKDYQFTVDGLDNFTGYTIKIVMSGSNQAKPVKIKDLRSIATK